LQTSCSRSPVPSIKEDDCLVARLVLHGGQESPLLVRRERLRLLLRELRTLDLQNFGIAPQALPLAEADKVLEDAMEGGDRAGADPDAEELALECPQLVGRELRWTGNAVIREEIPGPEAGEIPGVVSQGRGGEVLSLALVDESRDRGLPCGFAPPRRGARASGSSLGLAPYRPLWHIAS